MTKPGPGRTRVGRRRVRPGRCRGLGSARFFTCFREPRAAIGGRARSGEERDRPEPGEGRSEVDRPRPASRQVESEATGRAGQLAREVEQSPAERLGRDDPGAQADPGRPASEVDPPMDVNGLRVDFQATSCAKGVVTRSDARPFEACCCGSTRRIDSPRSSIRWDPARSRSRIASATKRGVRT
jgi:hypothetical protein